MRRPSRHGDLMPAHGHDAGLSGIRFSLFLNFAAGTAPVVVRCFDIQASGTGLLLFSTWVLWPLARKSSAAQKSPMAFQFSRSHTTPCYSLTTVRQAAVDNFVGSKRRPAPGRSPFPGPIWASRELHNCIRPTSKLTDLAKYLLKSLCFRAICLYAARGLIDLSATAEPMW